MGVREQIAEHVDYLRTEWEELSTLRHGCVCGKGDGGDAIDGWTIAARTTTTPTAPSGSRAASPCSRPTRS